MTRLTVKTLKKILERYDDSLPIYTYQHSNGLTGDDDLSVFKLRNPFSDEEEEVLCVGQKVTRADLLDDY